MIRRIKPDDIEQVLGLCRRLHDASRYRRFKPDWPTVAKVIVRCSTSATGRVFVAERNSEITGLLVAVAQEYWWADAKTGARMVSDLLFYCERKGDGRALMKKMIAWAWTVPRVVRVEVGVSSGIGDIGRTEKFYQLIGLDYVGPMFTADHPKLASQHR